MSVLIRVATPEDASLLPDIERSAGHLFREIVGLEWIADDHVMTVDQHLPAILAKSAWVACEEGAPVGFLSAERTLDILHIREVSVLASVMGRGIGRRLIQSAIAAANELGLFALTLTTFRDVPWNEPYYQRLGFGTLAAADLDQRLATILADEVCAGLPGDRRCAMRLNLVLMSSPG
ncbi:MAG: GNAT family N-acetyltransferase [Pseudomonadota bacterium]